MDIDEQAYLASYDASRYARPSVTVDVVLLTVEDGDVRVLLTRRADQPYKHHWSLVGTFLDVDETLDATAARALHAKAGLEDVFVEQLYTFGDLGRDPRTRVLSVAYYALVEPARLQAAVQARGGTHLRLATVAGEVAVDVDGTPLALPFDHAEILAAAIRRIRGKLGYSNIGFELLGEAFTLRDLRLVYEALLGHALNKDSFRRTVLARDVVEPTGEVLTGVGHRPPALYRFRPRQTREV